MRKITLLDLALRVRAINEAQHAPVEALSTGTGCDVYNVGNWSWTKAGNAGFDLIEVADDHGSGKTILNAKTKTQLFDLLGAILVGIDIGKNFQQGRKK